MFERTEENRIKGNQIMDKVPIWGSLTIHSHSVFFFLIWAVSLLYGLPVRLKKVIFISFWVSLCGARIIIIWVQQRKLGICPCNEGSETACSSQRLLSFFFFMPLYFFFFFKHQRITASLDSWSTSFLSREFQKETTAPPPQGNGFTPSVALIPVIICVRLSHDLGKVIGNGSETMVWVSF